MPEALLASDATVTAMTDLLLASTASGSELAGVCTYRSATDEERASSALGAGEIWILEGFRTTMQGDAWSVRLTVPGPGELSWHTHPGLRFGMAGFSDGDVAAVQSSRRPLLVIGYTFAAPETLSWLALAAGWEGAAVTAAVQAVLRAEAAGKLGTTFSRVGVAARMLGPDGRLLPVRRMGIARWRRALETGAFEVDRVVSATSNAANRWITAAWQRMRPPGR